jgi:HD superfamily phosphodiesterase
MTLIWQNLKIEKILETRLKDELGVVEGEDRYKNYVAVRNCLLVDIYDRIAGSQPNLSDHGPKHVKNVLNNIYYLLEEDVDLLTCFELYILCKSVLFHDVGNLHDRRDHQKKISKIYDECSLEHKSSVWYEEKNAIISICKAHCGESIEGDRDTIRYLNEYSRLQEHEIRIKVLASILRFADELAEGPQRTSHYMMKNFLYDVNSIIFHRYAWMKNVGIDRSHDRIRLSYNIPIEIDVVPNDGSIVLLSQLSDFLSFIYKRIEKLNQERQYAKHYCIYLSRFKSLVATLNFWYKDEQVVLDLNDIYMSDLVVPGEDPQKHITERFVEYKEERLIEIVADQIKDM